MDHFTWLGTFKGLKQILLKYPVMSHLVLGYMDDDHTYLKLGKVLLELQAAVDGQENIKFFLGERQKRPILKGVPASLMNGGDFVISEEQLDARVYALVNKDAHSSSWLLPTSSTVRTCSRVMGGWSLMNSSIVSPPSRKSIRLWTGTRVPRKHGVPLMRRGFTQTA